jgi:hypothetical protein
MGHRCWGFLSIVELSPNQSSKRTAPPPLNSSVMPQNLHTIEFFVMLGGLSMWVHIALAYSVRIALRSDASALNELFAFAPFGRTWSKKPNQMRIKLFFPWVKVGCIAGRTRFTRYLVWSARLAGTTIFASFLGLSSCIADLLLAGA